MKVYSSRSLEADLLYLLPFSLRMLDHSLLVPVLGPIRPALRTSDVIRYWFPENRALRRGAVAGWRLRVLSPLKGLLGRFKTGAPASAVGWAPTLATPKASYPRIGKMSLYGTGKHLQA